MIGAFCYRVTVINGFLVQDGSYCSSPLLSIYLLQLGVLPAHPSSDS